MFNKRWIVGVLCAIAVLALTACTTTKKTTDNPAGATTTPTESEVTIRYGWFGNPAQEETAKGMVDAFMKLNPKIKVEFENIPNQGYWEKLMTAVNSKTAPDVLRLTSYWGYLLGAEGAALDLKPLMPAGYLDDFDPALLTYAAPKGRVYGIPQSNNVQVIVYNKDIFAKAGVTAPTTPETAWTWDEMMNVCKKLQATGGAKYCYGIYNGAPQGRLINLYQTGGSIVDIQKKTSNLTSPQSLQALEIIKALYDGKYIAPNSWTTDYNLQKEFTAGTVAMFHGGNFSLAPLEAAMPGKYGVTFIPRNPKTVSMVGGEVYSITKDSKHPKEAWKLVEFMSNAENMTKWSQATVAIPPRKSLMGKVDYGIYTPHMSLIAVAAQYGSTLILDEFQVPGWSKVDTMLRERTVQLFTMPAKQWAEQVSVDINKATQP